MRISKRPEERKQEIIEAAMKLFREKGYEQTSMADIAKEVHVVQGLCYRYFPSKQDLFNNALDAYVEDCCRLFIRILCARDKTNDEKMELLAAAMSNPQEGEYQDFFHQQGNETFHEILSVRMAKYMVPYITAELEILNESGKVHIEDPETTAKFILFGQLALWDEPPAKLKEHIDKYQKLIKQLLTVGTV
jgi:AcrR family transcriptional regulator